MALLPIVQFLLWLFLFAVSSALTYLSFRGLFGSTRRRLRVRLWQTSRAIQACRALGFSGITLAALVGTVSGNGEWFHSFNVLSLLRVAGDVLLLASTPARLRRQGVIALGFVLLLLGEALLLLQASGALPPAFYPPSGPPPLVIVSTVCMDIGMAIFWSRYTRTVLNVRLTDKFTVAFALFNLLLLLGSAVGIVLFIQIGLHDSIGLDPNEVRYAFQNLDQQLILLFVVSVVLSAILSFFAARRLMAPIDRIGAALRAIGMGNLDYRLHGIRSRDEMQDLAQEINTMASRLKEADSLRAEFVSFASHELRNPLTTVKGFVETLQMVEESGEVSVEERTEIYQIILGECERLLRMTNELLDTSRVEAGRPVSLNLQAIDLRHSVGKVVGIMQTHTQLHTLAISGAERPLPLEADPDKIEQILINLLSNAIKYSPDGGEIRVSLRDFGPTTEIVVSDQGMGMTAEQTERIFDKFYRIQDGAGNRRQDMPVGTGIGLYLTRALVSAHGGSIRVESAPGKGTAFTVTLPKKQQLPALTAVEKIEREPSPEERTLESAADEFAATSPQ